MWEKPIPISLQTRIGSILIKDEKISKKIPKMFFEIFMRIEPIPVWREIGTGFSHMSGEATNVGKRNSSRITNGTFPIFHEWLSRRDEIIIPHERRSREWGIIISSQLLSQEWKIGNVPWVMSEEFYPSLFLSRPELTFPYKKENFNIWQINWILNWTLNWIKVFIILISIEKELCIKTIDSIR